MTSCKYYQTPSFAVNINACSLVSQPFCLFAEGSYSLITCSPTDPVVTRPLLTLQPRGKRGGLPHFQQLPPKLLLQSAFNVSTLSTLSHSSLRGRPQVVWNQLLVFPLPILQVVWHFIFFSIQTFLFSCIQVKRASHNRKMISWEESHFIMETQEKWELWETMLEDRVFSVAQQKANFSTVGWQSSGEGDAVICTESRDHEGGKHRENWALGSGIWIHSCYSLGNSVPQFSSLYCKYGCYLIVVCELTN